MPDLEPVALHGDAEVPGDGIAGHDGEGVGQRVGGPGRPGGQCDGGESEDGGAHHRPPVPRRNSSTVLMKRPGWSTKVMWPLPGSTTSCEPAIRSCMVRESDGSQ